MARTKPRPGDINLDSAPQMLEYRAAADRIAAGSARRILDWGCLWGQMTSLLIERGLDVTAFDYDDAAEGVEVRPLTKFPGLEATHSSDPVALTDRFSPVIWNVNRGLARVPGLNVAATNVELVARAR